MDIIEYKKAAAASVNEALEHAYATVAQQRRVLYPRLLGAPRRHYLGAAHASRVTVRRPDGSSSATNVVVSLWTEDGGEQVGFWAGDAFLSACQTSVSTARSRALSAAIRSRRPADALAAMLSSHALYPTATDCGFWRGWRRDRSITPHVAAVLARHHLAGHRIIEELREIVAQFSA
jgi:hypothetical protein